MLKSIYTFNVPQQIEVEKDETKEIDGKTVTSKIKVIESKDIEFIIKKPSRAEKEEADLIRAEYLSAYIRRGIISEAVLSKTYSDQGGVLDEFQRQHYLKLQVDYQTKGDEYRLLAATEKDNKEKLDSLLMELVELNQEIKTFLQEQTVYYQNTAEARARFKLIEYLFTHLLYFRAAPEKDPEPYFKGNSFAEKLKQLEKLEDDEDQVFEDMKNKALFVLSTYVQLDMNVSGEGLKSIVDDEV